MRWIINNIWNVLGVFIGVAGLATGYIYYRASLPSPGLTFFPSTITSRLVQKNEISKTLLKITLNDGREIAGCVFITNVYLWNSGASSIRDTALLKELSVDMGPGAQVLDVKPLIVTRPDVIGFQFASDTRSIPLSWKILEPSDGVLLQIIYAADVARTPRLVGAVEGIRSFDIVDAPSARINLKAAWRAVVLMGMILLSFVSFVGLALLSDYLLRSLKLKENQTLKRMLENQTVKRGGRGAVMCMAFAIAFIVFYVLFIESRAAMLQGRDGSIPSELQIDQPKRA